MKKIEAIIRTFALDEVRDALDQLDVTGMTVSDVRGYGSTGGHATIYPGAEYVVDFVPRLKIEVVIGDDQVNPVLDAITQAAWSGEPGDGMIFVVPVEDVVRIRTRDRGLDALR